VGALSGGNQQKVCVARALLTSPDLLFVSEPTRGIDIGAKNLLLNFIARVNREQNMTVVMISSELNELRIICDRIAIIADGEIQGILMPDAPPAEFALMMSGDPGVRQRKEDFLK
jgi:simple sugar transport system ATP-binding protein